METKRLLQSKTIWLAIIQAILGITIAVFTELDMIGYIAIVKSLADIALRYVTKASIK